MNLGQLYRQLSAWPFGKRLFSILAARKAPYFSSIRPFVSELTDSSCIVELRKSRKVLNHLGTVHAIAMCNACEFAFGLTMEAGLPRNLRWIPKGMTVRYLKKAETDLVAICKVPELKRMQIGDSVVKVEVLNSSQEVVMDALITVYVSERKKA